jgi:hypothetical protein
MLLFKCSKCLEQILSPYIHRKFTAWAIIGFPSSIEIMLRTWNIENKFYEFLTFFFSSFSLFWRVLFSANIYGEFLRQLCSKHFRDSFDLLSAVEWEEKLSSFSLSCLPVVLSLFFLLPRSSNNNTIIKSLSTVSDSNQYISSSCFFLPDSQSKA